MKNKISIKTRKKKFGTIKEVLKRLKRQGFRVGQI